MTHPKTQARKPQVRSVIVSRGWAVVDRFDRLVVSPLSPVYRGMKLLADDLSDGEPPLVLGDGSHCGRYCVARVRMQFDFPRKYMDATPKLPKASEAESNGRPHP